MTNTSCSYRIFLSFWIIHSSLSWTTPTTSHLKSIRFGSTTSNNDIHYRLPIAKKTTALWHLAADNSNNNEEDGTKNTTMDYSSNGKNEETQRLKERAQKAREDAEQMERTFTEDKIASLEKKLNKQTSLSTQEQSYIQDKIDNLKMYLNKDSKPYQVPLDEIDENAPIQVVKDTTGLLLLPEGEDESKYYRNENGLWKPINGEEEEEEKEEILGELSSEEQKQVQEMENIMNEFKSVFGEMEDVTEDIEELELKLKDALDGNITRTQLDFVTTLVGMVGMFNNSFTKGFWQDQKDDFREMFKTVKDLEENSNDPLFTEKADEVMDILPGSMSGMKILTKEREQYRLNDTDIEEFVDTIMTPNNDLYKMTAKPRNVVCGYILEGTLVNSNDDETIVNGDVLISRLQDQLEQLETSSLKDKIQLFYLRDPSQLVGLDDVQMADMVQGGSEDPSLDMIEAISNLQPPAILVLHKDLLPEPRIPLTQRVAVSVVSLLSLAVYAGEVSINPDKQLDVDFIQSMATGLTSPIVLGILGITLLHELGHFLSATLNKVKIAFPPTIIPSFSNIGVLGSSTQLLSPPKNNKALFDVFATGPVFGMAASVATLVYGLSQTMQIRSLDDTVSSIAYVPLSFLQLSSLTSAIIESSVGIDALLSINPLSDNIAVSPWVIAGHIGILLNALALLPTRNTVDGGRALLGAVSKSNFVTPVIQLSFFVFLLVQAFREWSVSSTLAWYVVFGGFFDDDKDVPCRNDVEGGGPLRIGLFVVLSLTAAIAISPAF